MLLYLFLLFVLSFHLFAIYMLSLKRVFTSFFILLKHWTQHVYILFCFMVCFFYEYLFTTSHHPNPKGGITPRTAGSSVTFLHFLLIVGTTNCLSDIAGSLSLCSRWVFTNDARLADFSIYPREGVPLVANLSTGGRFLSETGVLRCLMICDCVWVENWTPNRVIIIVITKETDVDFVLHAYYTDSLVSIIIYFSLLSFFHISYVYCLPCV